MPATPSINLLDNTARVAARQDVRFVDYSQDPGHSHQLSATSRDYTVELFDKTQQLADLQVRHLASGQWLAFQLLGAAGSRMHAGNRAVVQVGSLTAQWTSYADGIKEDLILAGRPTGDKVTFAVRQQGLSFVPDGIGGFLALDPGTNAVRFHIRAPTVEDASGRHGTATLDLDIAHGLAIIALDPAFVAGAAYPVTVDPTIDYGGIAIDGAPVTLTINQANDVAQAEFAGTAGQRVSLGITNVSMGYCCGGVSLTILQPDGSNLESTSMTNSGGSFDLQLPSAGTYTIQMTGTTVPGSATLTLSSEVSGGTVVIDGSSTTVTISRPGQNGSVTFTATAGQRLSLGVTSVTMAYCCGGLTVTIRNPDSSQLAQGIYGTNGGTVDFTPAVAGTYSILLDPGLYTGSATLWLSTEMDAGAIVVDGPSATATVSRPGQNARMTFSGTAGQKVNIGFTPVTMAYCCGGLSATLLNPDGTQLASATVSTSWGTLDATLPSSGTYSIFLDPQLYTGYATLTLSSELDAGSMTLDGDAKTVTISRPGQNARVSFPGIAGQAVNVVLTNVTMAYCCGGLNFAVLNPDGTQLASAGATTNGGSLKTNSPTTGTYAIFLDPGLYTGNATIGLSQVLPLVAPPTGTQYNNGPTTAAIRSVNTYTGGFAYTYAHTDLTIPGLGPSPTLTRSYNSNDTRTGPLGIGWTHNYNVRLNDPNDGSGDVVLVGAEGRSDRYKRNSDGTYARPDGVASNLTKNADQTFTVTQADQSSWNFDRGGRLLALVDRYQNRSALSYDANLRLVSVSDPAGRGSLALTYDGAGRLIGVADWSSPSRTVRFTYDGSGRLQTAIDREGKVTTYAYDGTSTRLATVTDANGNAVVSNTYDGQGRVLTQRDAAGKETSYAYSGTTTTATYPTTSFDGWSPTVADTYDSTGHLTQRVSKPSASETYTESYSYDSRGFQSQITDARNNATNFCNDASGNVLRVIKPSVTDAKTNSTYRPVTYNQYDSANNLVRTVPPEGMGAASTDCSVDISTTAANSSYRTEFTFDNAVKPGTVTMERYFTDPDLGSQTATTIYTYDTSTTLNPGRLVQVKSPRLNTTTYSYYGSGSQAGMLQTVTSPLGEATNYSYDAVGRKTSMLDPNGQTWQYSYDNEDRLRLVTSPAPVAGGAQLVTEYRYDGVGNRTVQIDANGQVTTYAYDQRNQLHEQDESPNPWTDPNAVPSPKIATTFQHDNLGKLSRVTRAAGDLDFERASDYAYDGLGRLRAETQYPSWPSTTNPLITSYAYDGNGNQTGLTDPLGQITTITYDTLNRATLISYSDGQTHSVNYTYDADGNRVGMTDGTGTTGYAYDELGRLTSVTSPGPKTIGYRWDANSNRTKLIYPDNTAVTYSYDQEDRLQSLQDWATRTVGYAYFPTGQVKLITNPNATTATYAYDNAQRLTQVLNQQGTTVLDQHTYTLDGLGNRTQVSEVLAQVGGGSISPTTNYSYDRLYRLTGDGTNTYTYDPAGNRLTWGGTNYSYDRADRISSAGPLNYSVNNNGNLIGRGADSFGYDQANRLTSAITGGTVDVYTYDGDGDRVTSNVGGTLATFVYDTSGKLPMLLTDGTRKYIYGMGLAFETDLAGNIQAVAHTDGLGSVRALTDASGSLTQTYRTDPFGAPVATLGTSTQPFGFAGEQADSTGFVYLRARMYDPQTGRFLQRDTVAKAGIGVSGWNRYTYGGSNPTTVTDPSGHCVWDLCIAEGAGVYIIAGAVAAAGYVWWQAGGHEQTLAAADELGTAVDRWWRSTSTYTGERVGPDDQQIAVKTWPDNLPSEGPRRYIPPKANHGNPEKNRQGEYVDDWGNRYRWDPVKREWDVQHRDGTHTNVGADGEVTHGNDNFPNKHPDEVESK